MMDANLRYLPKGRKFFAEVCQCDEDSELYEFGARQGDIILCEMLDEGNEDPDVRVVIGPHEDRLTICDSEDFDKVWLVYEGNQDGTGFLSDKRRDKAMALLEENK